MPGYEPGHVDPTQRQLRLDNDALRQLVVKLDAENGRLRVQNEKLRWELAATWELLKTRERADAVSGAAGG